MDLGVRQCHYELALKVNGGAAHKRVTSSKRLLDPIGIGEEDPIMFETCKEEPIHPNTSRAQARATSLTARELFMHPIVSLVTRTLWLQIYLILDVLIFAEDVLVAIKDAMILQNDVDDLSLSQQHPRRQWNIMYLHCSKTQQSSLEGTAR